MRVSLRCLFVFSVNCGRREEGEMLWLCVAIVKARTQLTTWV